MDKYCTSIGPSRELYKRGIVKDAEFWLAVPGNHGIKYFFLRREDMSANYVEEMDFYPAPMAEELLEIMPVKIDDYFRLYISKVNEEYDVRYGADFRCVRLPKFSEALGEMLIWLDDNGHLDKEKG